MPGSTPDLVIPFAVLADPLVEWPPLSQSMAERLESLLKSVQVSIGDGLTGDGSTATPLRVQTPMDWGQSISGQPSLDDYGSDSTVGQPIYVDSGGNVRTQPIVIPDAAAKAMTGSPEEYPVGMSVMTLTASTAAALGWPNGWSATVTTYRRHGDLDTSAALSQWWHRTHNTFPEVWYRSAAGTPSTWSPWRILVQDTGWINIPIQPGYAPQGTEIPQLRMVNGVVHSRGGWSSTGIPINSNQDPVGIIPVGYRPTQNVLWRAGTVNGGVTSEIFIASTGSVSIRSGSALTYHMLGVTWLTT